MGNAPAAPSVGASIADRSAPVDSSAGACGFTMGPAGPSTTRASPARRGAAVKPPGLVPSAKQAHPGGQGPPVYVPMFGGHMPYKGACARLCEAVTDAATRRGPSVPRTCLFSDGKGRFDVMLPGASRAARMSERDLGTRLLAAIDGSLTDAALAQLLDELFQPPVVVTSPHDPPPGLGGVTPCVGPFAVPRPRCGPGSGRSLVG